MYIGIRDEGTHPEEMSRQGGAEASERQKGKDIMKTTKTTKTFEIEIQRNNVTPAQFLAYVRSRVDAKGGNGLRGDLEPAYFAEGGDLNFDTKHTEPELAGCHERSVSRPYEMQTYIRCANGATYNEICEFTFDDEKTGHGYYYLVNVEAVEEEEQTAEEIVKTVTEKVEQTKTRSAWDRGVKEYAEELLEELAEAVEGGYVDESDLSNRRLFEKAMLNGAGSWEQFSEGGCSLCYDGQIAERLCAPWELRKTDNGRRDPNPRETWIDVQSRALTQAARLVLRSAF